MPSYCVRSSELSHFGVLAPLSRRRSFLGLWPWGRIVHPHYRLFMGKMVVTPNSTQAFETICHNQNAPPQPRIVTRAQNSMGSFCLCNLKPDLNGTYPFLMAIPAPPRSASPPRI